MAKSLSSEQIEERRKNLAFIRENVPNIDVFGDHQFTTTLLMQEEWLATVDELQEFVESVSQDAYILRGLRTRKCLRGTGGLALECQDCYAAIEEYCAPCYLRAIHLTPEMREGIREGVQAVKEGRITPWSEVKDELPTPWREEPEHERSYLTPDEAMELAEEKGGPVIEEYHGGIPKVQEWTEGGEPTRYKSVLPLAEAMELAGLADCCLTCGALPSTFVDGDCPKCNPVTCETTGQAHVWVKMGKAGLTDRGLSVVEWSDTRCLYCGIPVPVPDFDALEPVSDEEPTHAHLHLHPGAGPLDGTEHDHDHQLGHHSINFFGGAHHGPR